MNPEPPTEAGSAAPQEAPATPDTAAPAQAAADAAPAMPGDAASFDAPDTVPDQLREIPPELSPAGNSANTLELSPAGNSANTPELSPAGNSANTPELSPAACGAHLAELFPALFAAPGAPGPAKPIKLRIHADIQARAPGMFSKRILGIFFSRYTTSNAYLKALTLAPHRFDLDGQPAGEISDEHRRLAAEELARRHALAAERRAAQRPAPRSAAPAAEGEARPGARREVRPDRPPGPRPQMRPDARRDQRPGPRPPQQPGDGGQRTEQATGTRASSPPARTERPPRHAESAPQTTRPQHLERAPQRQGAQAPATLPIDPAQRERALLLRSFESSPLSKANFCALKGITEAALDAALSQAQAERGAPPNAAAQRGGSGR